MSIYLIEIMMFGLAVFVVALVIETMQSRRHLDNQRQLVFALHQQLEGAIRVADALGVHVQKGRGDR